MSIEVQNGNIAKRVLVADADFSTHFQSVRKYFEKSCK